MSHRAGRKERADRLLVDRGLVEREIKNIRFAIGGELSRAGESGFKQTFISNARGTAMFVKLARVYGKNLRQIDPYHVCHLARVRRVLRKRPMISSAFSIFFSKPGS